MKVRIAVIITENGEWGALGAFDHEDAEIKGFLLEDSILGKGVIHYVEADVPTSVSKTIQGTLSA